MISQENPLRRISQAHVGHSADAAKPARKSRYIPWAELLRRTFAIDIKCQSCGSRLRLRALIKTEAVIKRILLAMHLPAHAPELDPARPSPGHDGQGDGDVEDSLN
jgi:hypothetical protein